jgi:PAS domain S-box-containing protein
LRLSLLSKALFLVLVPLTFEIAFVYLLISLSNHADSLAQRLQDSQEMIAGADRTFRISTDLVLNKSSLIMGKAPGPPEGIRPVANVLEQQLSGELNRLEFFSNKYSNKSLAHFVEQSSALLQTVRPSLESGQGNKHFKETLAENPGLQEKQNVRSVHDVSGDLDLRRNIELLARLSSSAHEFMVEEEKIHSQLPDLEVVSDPNLAVAGSKQPSGEQRLCLDFQLLVLAGIVANLFMAWWLNRMFNRSIIARLSVLMENSERIALREPLKPAQPSSDEIGALDAALHRLENELEEARRRERDAVDNAVDVICSVSEELRFTELSPSAESNLGYQAGELLDTCCLDLSADDSSRQALEACLAGARSKGGGSAEALLKRKNMENGYFMWSVFWSEDDRSYFCVVHDISERRKAEENLREGEMRMRSLVEKMPAGLIAFDEQGKIETVNEVMGGMLGCPSGFLCGESLANLFDPENYRLIESSLQAAAQSDHLISDLRMRCPSSESGFPVEALVSRYESDGSLKQIAVIQDMSESKELEQVKREFLATLTHDIRAPLSSMRASLNMLSEGMLGSLSQEALTRVNGAERAASELIGLINGVLETARLESGRKLEAHELVDLNELCLDIIEDLNRLCSAKSVEIVYKSAQGLCPGNLEKLYKAVEIFFRRSLVRTPAGSTISVELSRKQQLLVLEIADSGQAITGSESFQIQHGGAAEENAERAAELSLARAIIKAHGGHILAGVDSSRKALISILLPAAGQAGA